uniref:Uncharacterized protein n=1 Tax=Glossina pallidipes TaxID=7398 RepID=A0A1B0AAI6_GLOPL
MQKAENHRLLQDASRDTMSSSSLATLQIKRLCAYGDIHNNDSCVQFIQNVAMLTVALRTYCVPSALFLLFINYINLISEIGRGNVRTTGNVLCFKLLLEILTLSLFQQ